MKTYKLLTISAVAVALLAMTATADAGMVPSWIKGIAGSWADSKISDREFVDAVQFLVDENVINVDPQIVEIEVIKEVQAQTMPTDNGVLWESIGALQEEDDKLRWEIYNNMIGAEQYDEYGDMIGAHEYRIIDLEAEIHDLKLQLHCVIESNAEADCTKSGMTGGTYKP